MRLAYDLVDVFTDRPFAGNQLAVVHGAGDLATDQCLALAREFNLSETTFPVPDGEREYAARIFTPGGEIPFAGHPTLGTAWVLRDKGVLADGTVTQVCGAGRIEVRLGREPDGAVELSAVPRDVHGPLDDDETDLLLEDLGLRFGDLAGPVWVTGCGLTFAHVPVREEALASALVPRRPMAEYARQVAHRDPFEGIAVYAAGGGDPLQIRSRVFVPGLSVPEDPATGSAAAALGVALVASGRLPDGGGYEITQGVELGRPSRLSCRVDADGGTATLTHVAGRVQPVASGEIEVPPA